jgi:electron transfer flavoprotein beta subunit
VLVSDGALAGSDALATSLILAKVIQRINPDLILCGTESTDARMSVIPSMLSERLELPQLSFAGEVNVSADQVSIKRVTDEGVDSMSSPMPVIVSVIEKINEPRYPSFKGIMAAKKKTIEVLSLADLGVSASEVGGSGAWSLVNDFNEQAARSAGVKVMDEGAGGNALSEFLAEKRLA